MIKDGVTTNETSSGRITQERVKSRSDDGAWVVKAKVKPKESDGDDDVADDDDDEEKEKRRRRS